MKKVLTTLSWILIALVGAWAYVNLAVRRGEPINSIYILLAALCSYTIGYRFYSKWVAARVLALNDRRATPCEVHEDGRDYVKTNKWIVFGHHFAAISGPGPLVGPVLAAQFGYLPGTLWILIGVVLGGAVQDFVILFASMRRDGKSLAQMVREELNKAAGAIGVIAILSIVIILLAVLALVVVNALAESPWGVFTVGATIPIAMFMGGYLRWLRAGRVLEASVLGVTLLLLAVWGHAQRILQALRAETCMVCDLLRLRCQRAASMAAARAARLPEHLHEAWDHLRAGGGCVPGPAEPADAGADQIHRRLRAGRAGQTVSLLFHHHRLRRHQRISHTHLQRHHAQDHHARKLRAPNRLWRDAARIARGHHGDDRSVHFGTWGLSRDEHQGAG
jgi:hypothetical protein